MGLATLGLMALLTTNAAHAKAKGHEVSLELGTFGAHDPAFDLFSEYDAVGSYGVRLGYGVTPSLTLLGSWHRSASGVTVEYYGYDEDGDVASYSGDETLFETAMVSHQFMLGPKAAWRWRPWLAPYGTVQAVGWWGRARIDDDLDHDDNPNQIRYAGFAPGGYAALGLDVKPLKLNKKGLRLATHIEAGYGITGELTLKEDQGTDAQLGGGAVAEVGDMHFRGFALRWGIGLAF